MANNEMILKINRSNYCCAYCESATTNCSNIIRATLNRVLL